MSPVMSGNVFFEAVVHDQLLSIISFEKVTWISWRFGSTSVSPDLGTVFTTTGGAFSIVISSDASAARFRAAGAVCLPVPACGSRAASSTAVRAPVLCCAFAPSESGRSQGATREHSRRPCQAHDHDQRCRAGLHSVPEHGSQSSFHQYVRCASGHIRRRKTTGRPDADGR